MIPIQSIIGFGLGLLLCGGSFAVTCRRRIVCTTVALMLLIVGMISFPLPVLMGEPPSVWMGDYEMHVGDRERFEEITGHESIYFSLHLSGLVLRVFDSFLDDSVESRRRTFRWLSMFAGVLFVAELLGVAVIEAWSAGALRYLALCVAAPVTLFFFGFREIGYLSLSAAGIPLILRGFSVDGRRMTVIAAACVLGLRSALHGFGLLSLAGGALSALVSAGKLRDRLTNAVVFGVWATVAWLGWLAWYLIGLKLPIRPGNAANLLLRPITTPYIYGDRIAEPLLSFAGLRDLTATVVIVGLPMLLLGLLSRSAAADVRRIGLVFALPSLAFLVLWWPLLGLDTDLDLTFAAFPAFFAGAWLCSRTRRMTAIGLVLAALAHVGFWVVAQSGFFHDHRATVVHVQWVDSMGDVDRAAFQRVMGLDRYRVEHRAGSTWSYQVLEMTPDQFHAIHSHEMVADAYGFDPVADAQFGPRIHVRWVETLEDARRPALEIELGLHRAEHFKGFTWRYQVPDASPDRLRAIVSHDLVVDTNGFDRGTLTLTAALDDTDARVGPVIKVRWVGNLGDTERTALERALGLYRAEYSEGTTWSYQVPDASPERLREIVAHDMVDDTSGFDRGTMQLHAPANDTR